MLLMALSQCLSYHIVFLDFDLMDGSHDEDDPKEEFSMLGYFELSKYPIAVALLNWIVEKPLLAAYAKQNSEENDANLTSSREGNAFTSIQKIDRRKRIEEQRNANVLCSNCGKEGVQFRMPVCSQCNTVPYCSRECQRLHWKAIHKHECEELARLRKAKLTLEKKREKKEEEEKARDIQNAFF